MESTETVNVKILFFAKARDLMNGMTEMQCTIPQKQTGKSLKDLIERELCPALQQLDGRFTLAVDREYVDVNSAEEPVLLIENSEIAVIPPLSGG